MIQTSAFARQGLCSRFPPPLAYPNKVGRVSDLPLPPVSRLSIKPDSERGCSAGPITSVDPSHACAYNEARRSLRRAGLRQQMRSASLPKTRKRMASPNPAGGKICVICHEDCSTRPRLKDRAGQYYCRKCVNVAKRQIAAGKEAEAPKQAAADPLPPAPPEPAPLDDGLDLLAEAAASGSSAETSRSKPASRGTPAAR